MALSGSHTIYFVRNILLELRFQLFASQYILQIQPHAPLSGLCHALFTNTTIATEILNTTAGSHQSLCFVMEHDCGINTEALHVEPATLFLTQSMHGVSAKLC